MESFMKELKISLPPFCNFTPEEWKTKGHEYDEIRDNMLGWISRITVSVISRKPAFR